ncbi:hypothetical protein CALVIDRAFT_595009 [Calocera viscosa TUFC12733]|uniref:Copper homeostasis protein cutC homolog n=1 Tax=Calocera viscosa (strain TUFC12733) TaxID=1330018 RepID=A0A167REZ6_CALVF|nr:hypothetical protein CALVIDRAFT_595009 [Calocera viscosa TUFC12733]
MPSSGAQRVLLEVCVDSLESAVIAQENGADRLEVCANLAVGGGTTPSLGLARCILEHVRLPIMVLIRCRTGDFYYTPSELAVMVADIRAIALLAEEHKDREVGVVIGALSSNGTVDEPAVRALLQAAGHMPVTFHRAFDMVRDADEAMRTISDITGIGRILTSGLAPSCITGLECIARLSRSSQALSLMPGSGIKSTNVDQLLHVLYPIWHAQGTGFEIHLSAGGYFSPQGGGFRREGMGFGLGVTATDAEEKERREWGRWCVRAEELREVRRLVDVFVVGQA